MAYVFDPDRLEAIVKSAVGNALEPAMDQITADLASEYPGKVYTGPRDWIFNNAGGAMGQLSLLYASLNEYLLFFGTPIGTEGHSGRYTTEVYDYMIEGEMWCYIEGETTRREYRPGDAAYLGQGQAKGYCVKDSFWVLEYSRGPIYTMLPFGLADSAISTLDFKAFSRTLWHYGRFVTKNWLTDLRGAAKNK